MSENIVHLVLARTPEGAPGVRGISMFLVPRYLPRADGSLDEHNRVRCLSIERKIGQHGGPTTTMLYGDDNTPAGLESGAVGYLVGELHRGLETMFVMMNEARFAVGLEGLAISERAYQTATAYARERIQGIEAGSGSSERTPIIRHPDVRRMLMRMRASTEAMRALTITIAAQFDLTHREASPEPKELALLDLLTPIMKGWNTETAQIVTSLGVQIHGGLGFMDECRASQHWRDARILPIYEGTTGIQAGDLVGRKIARDMGASALDLLDRMTTTAAELESYSDMAMRSIARAIRTAIDVSGRCVKFVVAHYESTPRIVLAGSVPLLELMGLATAGWQMARSALAAYRLLGTGDDSFMRAKITTAQFFAEHEMVRISTLASAILDGGDSVLELPEDQF